MLQNVFILFAELKDKEQIFEVCIQNFHFKFILNFYIIKIQTCHLRNIWACCSILMFHVLHSVNWLCVTGRQGKLR